MGSYLFWKTLHVVGAVLMVGNVTVTGVWALLLYRHRDRVPFRETARGILWTDLFFTFGGGALLTICGIQMIRVSGLDWRQTRWLLEGIGALALSSALWLAVLLPDQFRMERVDPADDATIRRLFVRWSVVGWSATVLLFWGLGRMVWKGG